jgi:ribosomal protein S18 acetylase RimI-like enzyme
MIYKLPEEYQSRMAGLEDLPAIHGLEKKKSLHYNGTPGMTLERLRNEYQIPGFDPSASVQLVEDGDGHLVGLVEVWDESDPPVHPYIWVTVDPEVEDRKLEGYLLEWAESRARQALERVDPQVRVAMRVHVNQGIASTRQALLAAGFQQIRHSFRMVIEMEEPPMEPLWPEGIRLRPYDPERDARSVFELDEEVFQDHFGFVKEDPEEGYQKFLHHMTGDDSYDPSLWFLAADGEELVAICLCRRYGMEDKDTGYISSLGVRRPWRRRGIAQALLQHAFGEFYRRGKRKVGLGVDAQSLTGATDLYQKVGMEVLRQFDLYEKVLRPGVDISVSTLENGE